jgi:RHS repeat-associated protein
LPVCSFGYEGLGSVVALSNVNGNVAEWYSYDVFGEPNRTSSINNPYFFTGRQYDSETGNYYYRARYYKPSIGRFLQTDPVGYAAGLNWYTYCSNNPINWVDTYGLCDNKGDWGAVDAFWHFLFGGGDPVSFGKDSAFAQWVASQTDAYAQAEYNILKFEVPKAARNIANADEAMPLDMEGVARAGYCFVKDWTDIKGMGSLSLGQDDQYSKFTYKLNGTVSVQDNNIEVSGTIEYTISDKYTYEKVPSIQQLGNDYQTNVIFEKPFQIRIKQ